jgi:hypothetical protein
VRYISTAAASHPELPQRERPESESAGATRWKQRAGRHLRPRQAGRQSPGAAPDDALEEDHERRAGGQLRHQRQHDPARLRVTELPCDGSQAGNRRKQGDDHRSKNQQQPDPVQQLA